MKRTSNDVDKLIYALIGSLLVVLLVNPVSDALDPPRAIPVAAYDEEIVPKQITFSLNDKIADLSIKAYNSGDSGNIIFGIQSDKVLSRAKDRDEFGFTSSENWYTERGKNQYFTFQLKLNESFEATDNFTLYVNYYCYEEIYGFDFNTAKTSRKFTYQRYIDRSYILT